MRPAYSIQAVSATNFKGAVLPDGLTVLHKEELYEDPRSGKMENIRWEEYVLPELGPTRILLREAGKPIVLPIKGRNFEIRFDLDDASGYGEPLPAKVTFTETTDPETPYKIWDPTADLREMIAALKAALESSENFRDSCDFTDYPGQQEEFEENLSQMYFRLFDLEKDLEKKKFYPPRGEVYFGQPVFIQNQVAPEYNGKCAFHLRTMDTGWGDSGNENYMVALDEEGYPVALFHEASCC